MNLVAQRPVMQRCFSTFLVAWSIFCWGRVAQADSGRSADDQLVCVDQHRKAQESWQQGRLLEARDLLEECLRPSCNAALRKDCDDRLTKVNQLIPSVVLSAESARGDLHQVEVWEGDTRVASELHGRPIAFDPGPHHLRFEREGCDTVEQLVVLSSGDQGRLVRVRLCSELEASDLETDDASIRRADADRPVAVRSTTGVEESSPLNQPNFRSSTPMPTLDKLLLVSGSMGMGVGIGFSIWSYAEYQSAEKSCAPLCPSSQATKIKTLSLAADVSLVLAATTLGVVAVRFLNRRTQLRVGARGFAFAGVF